MTKFWQTSISMVKPNEILVRGYPIEQLTRSRSFGDTVFLLLTGELPKKHEGRLVEAILTACCEHSLASPSVDAVRFVASCGVPLQTAVAAGVSAVGDVHGGAIEPCAKLIRQAVSRGQLPKELAEDLKTNGQRLPGFGHPVHSCDPRAIVLIEMAETLGIGGVHLKYAKELEAESKQAFGRHLTMNVDGVIAALICDMNIDPALGKAFFIIGRAAGYVAHAHEQMTKERPFKSAAYDEISYTGPQLRNLQTDN